MRRKPRTAEELAIDRNDLQQERNLAFRFRQHARQIRNQLIDLARVVGNEKEIREILDAT